MNSINYEAPYYAFVSRRGERKTSVGKKKERNINWSVMVRIMEKQIVKIKH
jgi:hypothetical protein